MDNIFNLKIHQGFFEFHENETQAMSIHTKDD